MKHRWDPEGGDRPRGPDSYWTYQPTDLGEFGGRRNWTGYDPVAPEHWSRRLWKFHWIIYPGAFVGVGAATGWSLGAAEYVHLIEGLFFVAVGLGYVASRSRSRAHALREAVSVAANAPGAEEPLESRRLWYWEMANWLLIIPGAYLIYRMPPLALVDLLALALFRYLIRRRRKEWAGELKRSWLILPLLYGGFLLTAVARVVIQALGK